MKRNLLVYLTLPALMLLCGRAAVAQSPYFRAVTNLNPVGYWPLHEVAAPALGNIETNYGSLGVLGTGYYPDWEGGTSLIKRGAPGAIAGDADTSVYFAFPNSNAGGTTNSLYVPRNSPLVTLNPPYTVECWYYPTNNNQGDIWGQSGYEGLNAGASGGGTGAVCGTRLYWNAPGFIVYAYRNSSTLNQLGSLTTGVSVGQWYHLVVTADANTNVSLYVNGNLAFTKAAATLYSPDYWTPFQVGNGRGNTRAVKGMIDEVAIYTNVLANISGHYSTGTNASASPTYFQTVTNDNPVIYFRMDGPTYSAPNIATWPVMTNYGSVGINGIYTPGTQPGLLAGPATPGGLPYAGLSGASVAALSGVSSFGDAGNSAVYNPTGAKPFSLIAMFRGNPCDNRFQNIVGHSDSSWRLAVNTNGKLQCTLGSNSTSVVNSTGVYNDGNWHQAVEVYTPAGIPTNPGTNTLYIDGVLDNQVNTVTTNGIGPGSALNVMLGADPQYTNNANGVGRQFSGQVCEVALFTNSLGATDVQTLYNASGVPPSITLQPVSATINQGSTFTNAVTVTGSGPLSCQWYEDGVARNGQTNASLILSPVQPGDASTNWYLIATNSVGSVTSAVVAITVNTLPTITGQSSTNVILFAGGRVTLFVTASGASPLSYQWTSNNVSISGATSTNYSLTNAQFLSPANFACLVTNTLGAATSQVVTVSLTNTPTAPYPSAVLADGPVDYWRLNEVPDDNHGNQGVIAHDYWGGNNGVYTNVSVAQPGYNTNTDATETSTQFGLTLLATADSYAGQISGIDFSGPTNTSRSFSVEAWVNYAGGSANGAGIVTKGYGNGGEQFDLDLFNGIRFFVRDAAGAVHGPTYNISSVGVWHHVVGVCDEPNGVVSLYVDGLVVGSSPVTPGVGILATTLPVSIGARRSGIAVTNYDFQFKGLIDDVAIYNYALSAGQVSNHYLSAGVAPVIVHQPPATTNVDEDSPLTVSATANGSPPLYYQWYDANLGQPIAGQTNATLVINNAVSDTYYLTVTNVYGTVNSSAISVSVNSGLPVLVKDLPPTVITPAGRGYIYTVQAQGTEPFSYFWYNGATLIAGQTNSSYSFATASGNYSVVVSNSHGTVTSTISAMTAIPTPTNSYASAVLAYNPVGYWPLQETNPPAPVTMETNYGTLGKLGNAYYAATNSSSVTFNQGGAVTGSGDFDASASFTGSGSVSYLFVPRVTPALTLVPPFSMECWALSSSTAFSDLMGEGGSGFNSAANAGDFAGFRMSYGGNNGGGGANLQAYIYNGSGGTFNSLGTPTASLSYDAWHHCVATYDGTNAQLFLDGSLQSMASFPMTIDTWSPITIGGGRWQATVTRAYTGAEDEVAIYTNVLSAGSVTNHYLAGITSGSNYMQSVLADNPLLYYRMDCAGYVTPDPSTYPAAVNYGTAPVNGAYVAGTVPGGVSGPPISTWGSNIVATPINGVISCIDAGTDPSFNPTGTHPFTAMTWFKTFPADGRVQTIMSHGVTNWAMNLDGTTGRIVWNTFSGGNVTSTNILNDGNWHFVAGVCDGVTNYLYVDGTLNSLAAVAAAISGESAHLYLGGNQDFVLVGNNMRYFAGALAQAAFYTNALSLSQIQQIYSAATPATPTISLTYSGGQLTITYTGTLVSSTNVKGPYAPVAGATSPYTVAPSGQKFYRARNP